MMEIRRPEPSQPIPHHAKRVFEGKIFDAYQWEQELYDGRRATFEVLRRPDTVAVFPVLEDGRIVLIEEHQPGVTLKALTSPGGRVERGEEPEEAVRRELREETGYEADEVVLWQAFQPVIKIDWAVYVFVAKGLRQSTLALDAGERISTRLVTFDELLELATDPSFKRNESVVQLLEARLDPAKEAELRKLFSPR